MNRRDLLIGAATLMQGLLVGAAAVAKFRGLQSGFTRAEAFIPQAQNPYDVFQMANIPTR